MIHLEKVAAMIEDRGVASIGRDLFVNSIPAEANGVLLRQYFGGTKIDHYLPGYRKTSYMLIVRAVEYAAALELINAAVAAVTFERDTEIDGVVFKFMRPDMEPFPYAFSPGDRIEFVVNIDCCYVVV